jgi:hypothetical protein
MKRFITLLVAGIVLSYTPKGWAAEWVKITENTVSDRFSVDKSSIQRNGNYVRYWEYREFPQPNNAFLSEEISQPVHSVIVLWSADCTTKLQRLRHAIAYDKNRKVLGRFNYGESGSLIQSKPGSSGNTVLNYVCASQQTPTQQNAPSDTPSP